MFKAIGFIVLVYVALYLMGAAPQHSVIVDGVPLTGWASSLLAVGAALVAMLMVAAVLAAVVAGLVAMVVGLPILIIALVLCLLFAPVLVPVIILMAVAILFLKTVGCLLPGI